MQAHHRAEAAVLEPADEQLVELRVADVGPEEAADVRGAAVSDYQAQLEQQWLKELHKKYKVKVNKKVFNSLK